MQWCIIIRNITSYLPRFWQHFHMQKNGCGENMPSLLSSTVDELQVSPHSCCYSSYDKLHNMKSRLDILSDIYGEKETGSDRRKTSRKACTVCIQQRLRFQDGKILNEKFISVANKQLCNDMKRMKMLVESSTPPKFCNPSGWFQRTRLIPIRSTSVYRFHRAYIPLRETSSDLEDSETG